MYRYVKNDLIFRKNKFTLNVICKKDMFEKFSGKGIDDKFIKNKNKSFRR